MKEILYIPSGKYFRFFDESQQQKGIVWTAEEFVAWRKGHPDYEDADTYLSNNTLENVLTNIIAHVFNAYLYENVDIFWDVEENKLLRNEFEIVEIN